MAIAPPKTASSPSNSAARKPSAATAMANGIKDFLKSIKDAVTNLEKETPTNLNVTTTGGDTLVIDTGDRDAYQVGDAVTGDDGTDAVADNDYALSDGNTITVAAGAISAITPTDTTNTATTNSAEATADVTQLAEAVAGLASVVTNLANDVKAIKGQGAAITNLTNKLNTLVKSGGKVALDDNAETKTTTTTTTDTSDKKTADEIAAERRANRNKK